MIRYIIAILAILVFGTAPINAESANLSDNAQLIAKAVDILFGENVILGKSVDGFQIPRPTEQGWAISTIMQKAKDPIDTFAAVARSGSYHGLLALYILDRVKYQAVLEGFRGADEVVVVTGDHFVILTAEEFVLDFLPQRGKSVFERLQFEEIPDLVNTVRGEPRKRCPGQSERVRGAE